MTAGAGEGTSEFEGQPIGRYLAELADRVPAPGGGAAAALHLAQAAALVAMVGRYTTGSHYAEHADRVEVIVAAADDLASEGLRLADADARAFTAVSEAYRLPRGAAAEKTARRAQVADALAGAAQPPAQVIHAAARVVALAEELLPIANRSVLTDVAAATEAARAAATTARLNVEVNLRGISDEPARAELGRAVADVPVLCRRVLAVDESVRAALV